MEAKRNPSGSIGYRQEIVRDVRDQPIVSRIGAWVAFLGKLIAECPRGWCETCAHHAASQETLQDAATELLKLAPPIDQRRYREGGDLCVEGPASSV